MLGTGRDRAASGPQVWFPPRPAPLPHGMKGSGRGEYLLLLPVVCLHFQQPFLPLCCFYSMGWESGMQFVGAGGPSLGSTVLDFVPVLIWPPLVLDG